MKNQLTGSDTISFAKAMEGKAGKEASGLPASVVSWPVKIQIFHCMLERNAAAKKNKYKTLKR